MAGRVGQRYTGIRNALSHRGNQSSTDLGLVWNRCRKLDLTVGCRAARRAFVEHDPFPRQRRNRAGCSDSCESEVQKYAVTVDRHRSVNCNSEDSRFFAIGDRRKRAAHRSGQIDRVGNRLYYERIIPKIELVRDKPLIRGSLYADRYKNFIVRRGYKTRSRDSRAFRRAAATIDRTRTGICPVA